MSMEKKLFGVMPDGKEVYSYTMRNRNGMEVSILNYGGAIAKISVPDRHGCFTDVVGGYDCLESYLYADGYQGALIAGATGSHTENSRWRARNTSFSSTTGKIICTAASTASTPSSGT